MTNYLLILIWFILNLNVTKLFSGQLFRFTREKLNVENNLKILIVVYEMPYNSGTLN